MTGNKPLIDALSVAAGAALGAVARHALDGVLPLLGVNILGAFLLGLLRPGLFWGRGVLGGFTSFSTFAYLATGSSLLAGAGYVVVTLLGCVAAWLLGDRMGGLAGRPQ